MARLLSLNVGLPREVTWNRRTVRTAIWKLPVNGRRMVRKMNIDGDGQADLAGHGGEQRSAFVYQVASYECRSRSLTSFFKEVSRGTVMATRSVSTGSNRPVPRAGAAAQATSVCRAVASANACTFRRKLDRR